MTYPLTLSGLGEDRNIIRVPSRLVTDRILMIILQVGAVSILSGCSGPVMIKNWYSPPKISALSQREPIALFRFHDMRAVADGKFVGQAFRQISGGEVVKRSSEIYADEPVAISVTRAFADGFRARGFPVVDRTEALFRSAEFETEAQVALSGDIVVFELQTAAWSPNGFDVAAGARPENGVRAICAVRLYVREVKSGRKLWEKEYRKEYERKSWERVPERSPPNKTPLGQVLANVVEEAVYDPELMLALGRIFRQ